MNPVHIAIVGLGTVGTGVARLLLEQSSRLARHAGKPLVLSHAVVSDLKKPRDVALPEGLLTTDLNRVLRDERVHIAAHLVGGLEPARSIMLSLLESGKDVVTANKLLLAEHGPELFSRARELGRAISFDASVAGGIPIITTVGQCLSANQIQSLHGILNGTSNYIVTQMDEQGADFDVALREAQRLGFAEADPTFDVDGSDAAQKLAILAHLSFGARAKWSEISRQGIDTLSRDDMRYARELGYRIKLIAVARLAAAELELHVSPTLVRIGSSLGEVRDSYNALRVEGDAVGRVFLAGRGAGQMPTASAVVADLIDLACGRGQITFRALELWSEQGPEIKMASPERIMSRYYLRLMVNDSPGVLAEVCGVLGRAKISIASVIQHEPAPQGGNVSVPLVIMTHKASEAAMEKSMLAMERLGCLRSPSVRMRVLEE